jgi:hypothetical protein
MKRIRIRSMLVMAALLIFTGCGLAVVHGDGYRGHDWDDYGGYMPYYDGAYGAHRMYHHDDEQWMDHHYGYSGHRMDFDHDYDGGHPLDFDQGDRDD